MVRHARGHLAERPHRLALDQPRLRGAQLLDHLLQPLRRRSGVFEQPRVLQRVRDVRDERAEELHVHRRERARVQQRRVALGELDDAGDAILDSDGQADESARLGELELSELRHLARDPFAERHLGADGHVAVVAARGDHAQRAALAVQQHDRAGGRAYRAHRPLQHEREQLLHVRHARRELDHLVEGAELEDEILQALGRATEIVEHAREGSTDLADLGHAPDTRDERGIGVAHHGLARADQRAGQTDDAIDHHPEDDEADHGGGQRDQHHGLGLERPQRTAAVEGEHGDQQGQQRSECEHDRRRLAQADRVAEDAAQLHAEPL